MEAWTGQQWGTVCGAHFDLLDANVVCRQLGYGTAENAYNSYVVVAGLQVVCLRTYIIIIIVSQGRRPLRPMADMNFN